MASPTQKLRLIAERLEPISDCHSARVDWYSRAGFGTDWMHAHYGRCEECQGLLNLDGQKKN